MIMHAGYTIRNAISALDMQRAAILFREYQQWLDVDLCFQGFEQELSGLPGDYAPPGGTLLLADREDESVGCVALRPVAEGVCEMKRLYVRDGARGSGLGRALAIEVIESARRLGYQTMRLDTLSRLHAAMQLYGSLGFHTCTPYYHNPLGDVVFWELALRAGEVSA